ATPAGSPASLDSGYGPAGSRGSDLRGGHHDLRGNRGGQRTPGPARGDVGPPGGESGEDGNRRGQAHLHVSVVVRLRRGWSGREPGATRRGLRSLLLALAGHPESAPGRGRGGFRRRRSSPTAPVRRRDGGSRPFAQDGGRAVPGGRPH